MHRLSIPSVWPSPARPARCPHPTAGLGPLAALALSLTLGAALGAGPAHAANDRSQASQVHRGSSHGTKGGTKSPKPASKARKVDTVRSDDAPDIVTYGRREDVMQFADALAQRQNLDPDWVRAQLAQARYLPSVARFIMPPPAGTAKNWAAYRARFVEPVRLRAGRTFWDANEAWLQQAEARYGVPPAIIVGIIGVETIYGQQTGNFRVIDALATLSFDFPTGRRDRSGFFRDELEQYLRLSRDQGSDPLLQRGSFAGAIGMPQFMPSSLRKYAVDFDGDGRIDLQRSTADVIGSVAHYLAEFGWQRDMPTHYEVAVPVEVGERAVLLAPDILPSFLPQEFTERGARLTPQALRHEGKLALVELQNGDAAPSYIAGTTNFYAITRYNWSSYYALAVISLGEAIKASR
jgi:membrane-bound lytic murein transglycosylase B